MTVASRIRSLIRTVWLDQKQHKFHFIHIPKNGGVSVRRALEMNGDVSLSKPYHYRYVDIVDTVGSDLRFFAIVRNPWRRTASRFMFAKQNSESWPVDDPRKAYIEKATFEQYVKEQKILPIPKHPGQPWMGPLSSWFNQLEWIRDKNGSVACECLRLETLQDDLNKFIGKEVTLTRRNATARKYDYRELYSDELIRIIGDLFQEDIDYFGFDFEGAASRNTISAN